MIKKWLSIDTKHLEKNNFSYFFHLKRALDIGIRLLLGGVFCVIHALIPIIFTDTASLAVSSAVKRHENFPVEKKE